MFKNLQQFKGNKTSTCLTDIGRAKLPYSLSSAKLPVNRSVGSFGSLGSLESLGSLWTLGPFGSFVVTN